ncbi:glycosyltransferase family 4 protein [Treponema primitia]|uniref:glycosyltransferase family 4 protein n=1 Tax=Treponema primitia TaxID=88058 RepID=UPI00025550FA|nr:glycosyltransferase family 1 protein [Treponema primitia]
MKVGIDTFNCDGGTSGVGVYLSQILKRIPPSGDLYELFGWDYDRYAYTETAPDLEFISKCHFNGNTANTIWHIHKYPEFAAQRKYNACFFPAAHKQLPQGSPCPSIGVVHDMAAYWGRRGVREHLGMILRIGLPRALRHLDRIIAVSQWVKQELVERMGVKESLVDVIPNGIDLSVFYPRPQNEESVVLIQPFSFRRPYILCVSRLDHPVKNHVRLIKAFDIFKERTRFPHRLVLAGSDSNRADIIKNAGALSKYRGDIFFTGHFPAKNLPELYSGADMVVVPSLYEGGGLGVLEAMASGVPVACSRSAALPEVAEHAALYFDPTSPEDMADRMVTMSTNRDTYLECRSQGLKRVEAFSWDRCAEKTLRVIQETAGH